MKLRNAVLNAMVIAGCVAMSLVVVGCGPKGVSDQQLVADIQSKLYSDPTARSANVSVKAANGVVTLTGDVPSSDVALQVVNIANGTSGTRSVDNQLKVLAAGVPPAPPMTGTTGLAPTAQNEPPAALPPPERRGRKAYPEGDRSTDSSRSSTPERAVARAPHVPVTVTIPAGTDIGVQMIDAISSKTNTAGQTFRASLSTPVVVDGQTVLPSGSDATVLLGTARGAGRIKGNSELEVRLVSIQHAGHKYDVNTDVHDEVGKGRGKQTAIRSGIGAAAGAVIGAIAGGGKGAAIGSMAGGGAGAGYQLATHGEQVSIPSETRLTFRLQSPVVVTPGSRE